MNCEKCQELLSDFLDGALSDADHATLNTHLEECLSCYGVRQELDSIISFCSEHRGEYDSPPNEQALWLRIRNTLESQPGGVRALAAPNVSSGKLNWLSGLLNRQWEFSLSQMAAAVAAIAIVVSFATALGMRSWHSTGPVAEANSTERTSPVAAASYQGRLDDRMKQQQQMIDYWNQRVERRKALWGAQTREAFERNLQVIDQAVSAHLEELRRNPQDEVSEEMLNVALNEKMDFLREFSDL
jgi:predicted anti-sigma-YlaC factor YlaD